MKELTQEYLKSILHYNPDTGIFIWKERKNLIGKQKVFNTRFSGKNAGSLNTIKYIAIRINDIDYLAHRLA
jgi:hypothetical protein